MLSCAAIDQYLPPLGPQQQTHRMLLQQVKGTDRQTDGHRTVTHTPCSTYYADRAANNLTKNTQSNAQTSVRCGINSVPWFLQETGNHTQNCLVKA